MIEAATADITTSVALFPVPYSHRFLLLLFWAATIKLVDGVENYDVLDEDVINLPVGKFPEPECEYRVRYRDRSGPELKRCIYIVVSFSCFFTGSIMIYRCSFSYKKK